MTLLFAPIILALATQNQVVLPSPPAPPSPDKVMATVNGHPILAKELEPYLWDWTAYQVGQTLIDNETIKQAAAAKGITVNEDDVKKEYQDFMLKAQAQSHLQGAALKDALQKKGINLSYFPIQIRSRLLLQKIAEGQFDKEKYVKTATLVVRPKSQSAADTQAALTSITAAYDELQKGATWDAILTKYSSIEQAAAQHGEMGWAPLDGFPKPTQIEFQTLKLMAYSKPVQTQYGFQIYKLEEHGKDATPQEASQMKSSFVDAMVPQLYQKLHNDAKIETSF